MPESVVEHCLVKLKVGHPDLDQDLRRVVQPSGTGDGSVTKNSGLLKKQSRCLTRWLVRLIAEIMDYFLKHWRSSHEEVAARKSTSEGITHGNVVQLNSLIAFCSSSEMSPEIPFRSAGLRVRNKLNRKEFLKHALIAGCK